MTATPTPTAAQAPIIVAIDTALTTVRAEVVVPKPVTPTLPSLKALAQIAVPEVVVGKIAEVVAVRTAIPAPTGTIKASNHHHFCTFSFSISSYYFAHAL
jgi:hypothetical protein